MDDLGIVVTRVNRVTWTEVSQQLDNGFACFSRELRVGFSEYRSSNGCSRDRGLQKFWTQGMTSQGGCLCWKITGEDSQVSFTVLLFSAETVSQQYGFQVDVSLPTNGEVLGGVLLSDGIFGLLVGYAGLWYVVEFSWFQMCQGQTVFLGNFRVFDYQRIPSMFQVYVKECSNDPDTHCSQGLLVIYEHGSRGIVFAYTIHFATAYWRVPILERKATMVTLEKRTFLHTDVSRVFVTPWLGQDAVGLQVRAFPERALQNPTDRSNILFPQFRVVDWQVVSMPAHNVAHLLNSSSHASLVGDEFLEQFVGQRPVGFVPVDWFTHRFFLSEVFEVPYGYVLDFGREFCMIFCGIAAQRTSSNGFLIDVPIRFRFFTLPANDLREGDADDDRCAIEDIRYVSIASESIAVVVTTKRQYWCLVPHPRVDVVLSLGEILQWRSGNFGCVLVERYQNARECMRVIKRYPSAYVPGQPIGFVTESPEYRWKTPSMVALIGEARQSGKLLVARV